MHTIKNLTNSPYDLDSVNGSLRLPAMGSLDGEFTPEYLAALKHAGIYEVTQKAAPKQRRQSHGD